MFIFRQDLLPALRFTIAPLWVLNQWTRGLFNCQCMPSNPPSSAIPAVRLGPAAHAGRLAAFLAAAVACRGSQFAICNTSTMQASSGAVDDRTPPLRLLYADELGQLKGACPWPCRIAVRSV